MPCKDTAARKDCRVKTTPCAESAAQKRQCCARSRRTFIEISKLPKSETANSHGSCAVGNTSFGKICDARIYCEECFLAEIQIRDYILDYTRGYHPPLHPGLRPALHPGSRAVLPGLHPGLRRFGELAAGKADADPFARKVTPSREAENCARKTFLPSASKLLFANAQHLWQSVIPVETGIQSSARNDARRNNNE